MPDIMIRVEAEDYDADQSALMGKSLSQSGNGCTSGHKVWGALLSAIGEQFPVTHSFAIC